MFGIQSFQKDFYKLSIEQANNARSEKLNKNTIDYSIGWVESGVRSCTLPNVCSRRVDAVESGARLDMEVTRHSVDHDEARQLAPRVVLLQSAEPDQ